MRRILLSSIRKLEVEGEALGVKEEIVEIEKIVEV